MSDYERFLSKVDPEPNSGCWLWNAAQTVFGYGQFWMADRDDRMAHRYSYEYHKGKIPDGLCVLHKCDIPSCVNPDHLFLGTHRENALDKVNKGRAKGNSGTGNHLSKLDETKADQARVAVKSGALIKDVARQYGVHASTISKVLSGKTWRAA